MFLAKKDFRDAIRALGLEGQSVEAHTSFKSFGSMIEGGADTLIDSFLAEGCTFMVFAYTVAHYGVYPPMHLRPRRNAMDYSALTESDFPQPRVYTTESTEITRGELGIVPDTVVKRTGRVRSRSPLNSFAALGPAAVDLMDGQTALDVFAPLRRLCELDGYVLLMGVNLDRATILHYAEAEAGRAPFVKWALNAQGETEICHVGSCSGGFNRFDALLAGIERRVTVGESVWRCFPARDMVAICAAEMKQNPEITRCDTPGCARCADAIAGGPVW